MPKTITQLINTYPEKNHEFLPTLHSYLSMSLPLELGLDAIIDTNLYFQSHRKDKPEMVTKLTIKYQTQISHKAEQIMQTNLSHEQSQRLNQLIANLVNYCVYHGSYDIYGRHAHIRVDYGTQVRRTKQYSKITHKVQTQILKLVLEMGNQATETLLSVNNG